MLLNQLTKFEFGTKLSTLVSPARPIQSIEHLNGRTIELDRIEKALFAQGRHIFIYGDRGVGKSSLAAAAANQCQSSDATYIDVSCSPDSTLKSTVINIAYKAINASRVRKTKNITNTSIEFKFFKIGSTLEITLQDLNAEIHTLSDAVDILNEVSLIHSDRPVIVLDEFDRISDPAQRNLFADLVKQLGDKKINITFIFTGVGSSLDDLLGAHPSAIRQFETIELKKLSWTARWNIALQAVNAFDLELEQNICTRIAAVSDGYPYYVHLITEKLLWRIFEDSDVITNISWDHYHSALNDAIESISAELSRPYEMAVSQRKEEFEEILWATADSEYLDRNLRDMFGSYSYIMKKRTGRDVLNYEEFTVIVRKLKSKTCGEILIPSKFDRRGWVSFKENVLRGYVRMQAESQGVELVGEPQEEHKLKRNVSSSTKYYSSSVPSGVFQGRRR